MLTNNQINQSQQLTEEYSDGHDHERHYPDPSNVFEVMERRHERQQLEHSLAIAFTTLQKERNPTERTRLWEECGRLGNELQKLMET